MKEWGFKVILREYKKNDKKQHHSKSYIGSRECGESGAAKGSYFNCFQGDRQGTLSESELERKIK